VFGCGNGGIGGGDFELFCRRGDYDYWRGFYAVYTQLYLRRFKCLRNSYIAGKINRKNAETQYTHTSTATKLLAYIMIETNKRPLI